MCADPPGNRLKGPAKKRAGPAFTGGPDSATWTKSQPTHSHFETWRCDAGPSAHRRGPGIRRGVHMTMQSATPRAKRILMIGAPGAGKGTQADLIAQQFGITHIASGDLLRRHIAERTAIGKQVEGYVN